MHAPWQPGRGGGRSRPAAAGEAPHAPRHRLRRSGDARIRNPPPADALSAIFAAAGADGRRRTARPPDAPGGALRRRLPRPPRCPRSGAGGPDATGRHSGGAPAARDPRRCRAPAWPRRTRKDRTAPPRVGRVRACAGRKKDAHRCGGRRCDGGVSPPAAAWAARPACRRAGAAPRRRTPGSAAGRGRWRRPCRRSRRCRSRGGHWRRRRWRSPAGSRP